MSWQPDDRRRPYVVSLTGRQVVTGNQHYLLWRRGLDHHFELAIAELTRRQLMAPVENTAKTGKRAASKEPRKQDTFLAWYLGEGCLDPNVLTLSSAQRNSGPKVARRHGSHGERSTSFLDLPSGSERRTK
ncbi:MULTISPECIES: hypothetical protein [Bradyrhizobium]|uniref:hypothetical protein n=1 Tax=Bradyrhizobium centrosematis TaxID=1300039 RepID=UPI002168E688|nr:hypothetical protein [Bradyrhizobium centrosematis]MCS3765793.1 hypothetical protein [Bradyrhizobium centrosematis]MCS3778327.1 hypothetical protein [Bradyrhizobium centrosematis]